ncbi:MAG: hypothetical protein ABIE43_05250 [Patescibacteria group bacterium]
MKKNNFYTSRGEKLKIRTKQFALRIIKLSKALPRNDVGFVISR